MNKSKFIWLIITIVIIVISIIWTYKFIIGMLIGMIIMAYIFINPHPLMIGVLRKMFGVNKPSMIDEMVFEPYEEKKDIENELRVKYKK